MSMTLMGACGGSSGGTVATLKANSIVGAPACYNSISDDFNRADETPLASPYADPNNANVDVNLESNQVVIRSKAAGQYTGYIARTDKEVCGPDCYIGFKLVHIDTGYTNGNNLQFGLRGWHYVGNVSPVRSGGYPVDPPYTTFSILEDWGQIATSGSRAGSAEGHVLKFEANGSDLTVYQDSTAKVTVSDSTYTERGEVEAAYINGGEAAAADQYWAIDDFILGTV